MYSNTRLTPSTRRLMLSQRSPRHTDHHKECLKEMTKTTCNFRETYNKIMIFNFKKVLNIQTNNHLLPVKQFKSNDLSEHQINIELE